MSVKVLLIPLVLAFSNVSFGQTLRDNSVEVESEGSYLMGVGSSKEVARKVAIFEAKRKAIELAARYLSAKGLIEAYDVRKKEIFSLAARETEAQIQEQKWEPVGKEMRCFVRVRAKVQISDFVKAEMESRKMDKVAQARSFRDEMEQPVPKENDPGKDISKVYRLLRKRQWRMAMIYLDHLEVKYPDWGELYTAKATVYYADHEPLQMRMALEKACQLENREACEDLKSLKRVHDTDLGPGKH